MIRAADACVIQLESRRLFLSILCGARSSKVHCVPQPVELEKLVYIAAGV